MGRNKKLSQKFINSIVALQQARRKTLLIGMPHELAHGSMAVIKEPDMRLSILAAHMLTLHWLHHQAHSSDAQLMYCAAAVYI